MAKIKTPQIKLKEFTKSLIEEVNQWEKEYKTGCSDPFWPDGFNLNLLRNHTIYYKGQILQICEENNLKIPQEYFIPTPSHIDDNYFANPKSERAIKIIHDYGLDGYTAKVNKIVSNQQLSLF